MMTNLKKDQLDETEKFAMTRARSKHIRNDPTQGVSDGSAKPRGHDDPNIGVRGQSNYTKSTKSVTTADIPRCFGNGVAPRIDAMDSINFFARQQESRQDEESLVEPFIADDLGYCDELVEGEQWLVSVNILSILTNRFKLEEMLLKQKPKIVALQEVWQVNNVHLSFENFYLEVMTRTSRRGGGVGILIHNAYSDKERKDLFANFR